MDKQEQIDRIYEVVGIKMEHYNGPDSAPIIQDLPVMIGDILKYIDTHCNWIDVEDGKSRDMEKHKGMIIALYNYFIQGHNLPIEKQSEQAIGFVYNLLSKN